MALGHGGGGRGNRRDDRHLDHHQCLYRLPAGPDCPRLRPDRALGTTGTTKILRVGTGSVPAISDRADWPTVSILARACFSGSLISSRTGPLQRSLVENPTRHLPPLYPRSLWTGKPRNAVQTVSTPESAWNYAFSYSLPPPIRASGYS